MAEQLMTRVHNLETGEVIDRPMTPEEIQAYELAAANAPGLTN